jgi:hypothetical protein
MGNHIDTQNIEPSHGGTTGVGIDGHPADVDANHVTSPGRGGPITDVALQHNLHRQVQVQFCCIRLLAASAIVAGVLLGTASFTLAQAEGLITSASALIQETPTQAITAMDGQEETEQPSFQQGSIASAIRADAQAVVRSMFNWEATSRALRCSYVLIFEGSIRRCQVA